MKKNPLITQVDDFSTPVDVDMTSLVANDMFVVPELDEVIHSGSPDCVMAESDIEAEESSNSYIEVTVVEDCRPEKPVDGFAVERKGLKCKIRLMETRITVLIPNKESVQ